MSLRPQHIPKIFSPPSPFFAGWFVVFVLMQNAFVRAYLGYERTYYFWDHAMYQNMATNMWIAINSGLDKGWALLRASMTEDYNNLFTLPSLISFVFFGANRWAFIFTNFFVFFVAYEIGAAFVLRRLFSLTWPVALMAGAALCSFIPPLWTPLMEGYPDLGPAAALAFAVGVAFRPLHYKSSAPLFGFLLAFSFLLRRHYAYPATVLLAVKGAHDLVVCFWRAEGGHRRKALRDYVLNYCVCGLTLTTTIMLLAPGLISSVLSTDYLSLYRSYETTTLDFVTFAISRFGILPLFLTLLGLIAAYRFEPGARDSILFLIIYASFSLIVWCAGPAQAGNHYMLHALPIVCVAGLSGLFLSMAKLKNKRFRLLSLGALSLALVANGAWALWFSPISTKPNSREIFGVFSAPRPPLVRKDYGQLQEFCLHLANTSKTNDFFYAVGSSFVFNQDLLRAVYMDGLGMIAPAARFVSGPEIDSRGFSPLHAFAQANVYVVPNTPQYHLSPKGQQVIKAVTQPFLSSPPNGPFRPEDRVFNLEDGVKIRVWRRAPWTPETLHKVLTDIRRDAPMEHPDWVALVPKTNISISSPLENKTDVLIESFPRMMRQSLFYDVPLSFGDYVIRFMLDAQPSCRNLAFVLRVKTARGKVILEKPMSPKTLPGRVGATFKIPQHNNGASFAELSVESQQNDLCLLVLRQLTIEKND